MPRSSPTTRFTGQTSAGRIEVVGEQVSPERDLESTGCPLRGGLGPVSVYNTTTTPSTLTIAPGTVVKFASGAGLQVGYNNNQGALIAQGTASNRITFTRNAATGTWGSVSFVAGTVNATTDLENVDIQYSTGVTITSASPTIRNSTITDVNGYGLNSLYANPIIDTVTITNNGTMASIFDSSSPVINRRQPHQLHYSGGYGIYGSGSPVISNYNVSIVNSRGQVRALFDLPLICPFRHQLHHLKRPLYRYYDRELPIYHRQHLQQLGQLPASRGRGTSLATMMPDNTFTGLTQPDGSRSSASGSLRTLTWTRWLPRTWWSRELVSVYRHDHIAHPDHCSPEP